MRNYFAGFANDPVLKVDNVGKVGDDAPAPGEDVKQEGQGDVEVKDKAAVEGQSTVGTDENSDENGDAVLLEKPRWVFSSIDPSVHSINRLTERGAEKGHSTHQGWGRSVFNQTNIGTGNLGETAERWARACMGLSERYDAILNWNWKPKLKLQFSSVT